jgi:hypothetical protein
MGERGPVPKHSSQRRRTNKGSRPERAPISALADVEAPPAQKSWAPAAKRWYESLAESGQAQFFEPSDWQAAQIIAGELSTYLRAKKRSAMMFSHLWSAMTDLLTTEGARRRLKIEIDREVPDEDGDAADVAKLDDYRDRASG